MRTISLAALFALIALPLVAGCAANAAASSGGADPTRARDLPAPPREFRAVWVATVKNIDWPDAEDRGSPTRMRAHMQRQLDLVRDLNMHAVLFQARPTSDALYRSDIEPWSEWLTGRQGRPPALAYDPLEEWVRESHRRGLEAHVWVNPYRARHREAKTPLAPPHLALARPDLVHDYVDYKWIDPGEPDAQDYVINVMKDIVTRYPVDGLVFDDYFYPYPVSGKDFPDDRAWNRYQRAGGTLSRDDWRRENVNTLIRRMNEELRAVRPDLVIGVSPFGIWRPNHPAGVRGFDAYASLYADARLWLREGWVDYMAPQLYWPIASEGQPFNDLLAWWRGENPKGRKVYTALYTSRIQPAGATGMSWDPQEIVDQIEATRAQDPEAPGQIHFSLVAIEENRRGIADRLRRGPYAELALPPRVETVEVRAPSAPRVALREAGRAEMELVWSGDRGDDIRQWVVWLRYGDEWQVRVLRSTQMRLRVPIATGEGSLREAAVAGVAPSGVDGPPAFVTRNRN